MSVAELVALGKRQGYVMEGDVAAAVPYDDSRADDEAYEDEYGEQWAAAVDALRAHGIKLRRPPEPIREYGAERIASAHATGRAVGPLFAQNLLDLAAGERPISYPYGGVHRDRGAESYALVHFPGGLTIDVGVWSKDDARGDAALIGFVPHANAITVTLVSCDGTMDHDLTCWFGIGVNDGRIATSRPHAELRRVREDVGDAFLAGLREGMERHREFNAIGFGALGDFDKEAIA